jgi:hypothetical protein
VGLSKVDVEVFKILDKTKFPFASSLVGNYCLKYHFYDLTPEDLEDDELLGWFREKKLISAEFNSELASVRNAYEEYR